LVETIELPNHPFFIATQSHPEFQSSPSKPHPLFHGLIQAAIGKPIAVEPPEVAALSDVMG
jgi:CTP synthase